MAWVTTASLYRLTKKTDLLVYHARTYTEIVGDPLWDPNRHTYVKTLRWDDQAMPVFGRPSVQD